MSMSPKPLTLIKFDGGSGEEVEVIAVLCA